MAARHRVVGQEPTGDFGVMKGRWPNGAGNEKQPLRSEQNATVISTTDDAMEREMIPALRRVILRGMSGDKETAR
jgi:hypothetical protein